MTAGAQRYAWRPVVGTATVAALWGTSGILVRHLDLTAAQIACARAAIAAIALAPWLMMPYPRTGRQRPGQWLALVVSGVLLAVHWWTFILLLQRIPIGTVLLGIYLAPLVIAVLAPQALGETVTARQAVGLGLTLAGSVLVFQPRHAGGWDGVALIGLSAVTYAGSIVTSKRVLATAPALSVSVLQLGLVAVLLAPVALAEPIAPSGGDLARIGLLGVLYTAVAQLTYLWCLRSLPATTSGILLYLEPVSALASGWLFLSERPTIGTAFGALLILAAGATTIVSPTSMRGHPQ